MRLINVETFKLEDFFGSADTPSYAILSHTWDGDEVTYQDIADLDKAQQKGGFLKIAYICEQARHNGIDYAWVDTCCIDKTSSHELTEAINSMYKWYRCASVCYVYLSDVSERCPPLSDEGSLHPRILAWIPQLERSRWFTRGWTLQELIAPNDLHFFGQSWNYIGSLPELIGWVSRITNIQADVLDGSRPLSDLSIARRLSWAARRKTSRPEDEAYSLFGILDVNMPLLYGEGKKAFIRLQEEIIRQSTDQSIFAWDAPFGFLESRELLLAPSPACFLNGSRIVRRRATGGSSAYRISNKGLEITLPIVQKELPEDPSRPYVTLGILDCKYEGSPNVLALVMKQHPFSTRASSFEVYVSGYERLIEGNRPQYGRILAIHKPTRELFAHPTTLTITKDLQSQEYIQHFSSNKPDWFPVRFMGDFQRHTISVEHAYPEDCWYETSLTMRLRNLEEMYGGIVVRIEESKPEATPGLRATDAKYILVAFGLSSNSQSAEPTRKIYAISNIDPNCPIEPHLGWLTRSTQEVGVDAASLRLNDRQRLVAQLWNGALTVSIENSGDAKTSRAPSIDSLSPPTSPVLTKRHSSFSGAPRRDSMMQSETPQRSNSSEVDSFSKPNRTKQCEHCRYVKAKMDEDIKREEDERRQRQEEEAARRRKQQRQKQTIQGAKKVGTGLAGIGVLADVAELLI